MMADNTAVLDRFETVKLSKLLSYVLRHGAQKEKLVVRSDGYIAVNDLVTMQPDYLYYLFCINWYDNSWQDQSSSKWRWSKSNT